MSKVDPNSRPAADIRVAVVDDHPLVRGGLSAIEHIDPCIKIIAQAGTLAGALAELPRLRPDVALIDIRLPDGSGIDLCRAIKTSLPRLRVICLTSFAESALVLDAMEAGADGYLLKQNDAHQIVRAIYKVLSGGTLFDTFSAPGPGSGCGSLSKLSAGERRVLAEVAQGRTDKEVAVKLNLSVKTVRNSLDRIFVKLGVHTRTAAAMLFAQSRGCAGTQVTVASQ